MPTDLIRQWREEIVGDWKSELAGTDLLELKPSADRFSMNLVLRADGTAEFAFEIPDDTAVPPQQTAPFPTQWELDDDRVLSIAVPVAPMPEYGMPEWTEHVRSYDVLAVTDWSLSLSNRRFDGEDVIVMRRFNSAEHQQRQIQKYGQALNDLRRVNEGDDE